MKEDLTPVQVEFQNVDEIRTFVEMIEGITDPDIQAHVKHLKEVLATYDEKVAEFAERQPNVVDMGSVKMSAVKAA